MKVNEILNLTVDEFEKELSQENFDYVNENYVTVANGLEMYQEGARLSGEE